MSNRRINAWLARLSGRWEFESELLIDSGCEPGERFPGAMHVRLEGQGAIVDWTATYGETTVTALQRIALDSGTGRATATWQDDASDHTWRYEGAFDGDVLVFEAEGPSCLAPGELAQYRDYYKFTSDDLLVHRSTVLADGGRWVDYMRNEYRRRGVESSPGAPA